MTSGVVANLELGNARGHLPLPSPPLPSRPVPSPPLSFHSFLSPPLPSLPLEVRPLNPARGPGERYKPSSGVWGEAPAEIEFGTF